MKKFALTLCLGMFVAVVLASPAMALPPFDKEWKGKYLEGNTNDTFVKAAAAAKCNVCHDSASKSKKDKNEYGKAIGKYLTKDEFNKIKADAEAARKFIMEGFAKAEAEKSADGKTYGERIQAGTLPSGG
jgi:hypothetical protein